MKASVIFLVAALAASPARLAAAQSASTPGAAALAAIPDCAKLCLLTALANSPCAASNTTCVCTNQAFQDEATACVMRSCTVKEILHTKNITSVSCNAPIRDRSGLYNTINITFGTITGVFFLLRIYFKLCVSRTDFWLDDWFIIVAFFTAIPSTVMNTHGLVANGLGRDIWTLDYETITDFIKFFYIMEIMYFTHLPLLKASLLLFYLRIFPYERVRRVLWITLALNAVAGAAFLFIAIFQCRPISYYWTMWDSDHAGTCLNLNAVGWSNAAFSIALDVWMLIVPVSQLPKLRMHWKKKLGIGLMFFVGTFVTVVSMLRLQSLVHFSNSTNPTWDQWDVANWSTIEINMGIMCACMPALRGILVRIFPRLLGSGSSTGSSRFGSGGAVAMRPRAEGYSDIVLGASSVQGANASTSQGSRFDNPARTTRSVPGDESDISDVEGRNAFVARGGEEGGGKGIVYARSFTVDYDEDSGDVGLPIMGRVVVRAERNRDRLG